MSHAHPAHDVTSRSRRWIGPVGWAVLALLALTALMAFGVVVAMDMLGQAGPVRIVVDGKEVFGGLHWADWARENRLGFAIVVGFTLVLVLMFVLMAIAVALVLAALGSALALVLATAPVWIPLLLIALWLRRKPRGATPPAPATAAGSPQ